MDSARIASQPAERADGQRTGPFRTTGERRHALDVFACAIPSVGRRNASPPRPDIDPLARPNHLPVVAVGPAPPVEVRVEGDAIVMDGGEQGEGETVIDMSVYVDRFGDEPSLPTPASASPTTG